MLNPGAILPPESDYNSLYRDIRLLFNCLLQIKPDGQSEVSQQRRDVHFLYMWLVGPPLPACYADTVTDRYCSETLTKSQIMSKEILCILDPWILMHAQAAKLHIVMQARLLGGFNRALRVIIYRHLSWDAIVCTAMKKKKKRQCKGRRHCREGGLKRNKRRETVKTHKRL